MSNPPPKSQNASPPLVGPAIYHLAINRFRGIRTFSWYPVRGINVILGGGDAGKTTILDAIGLLLSPTNAATLSDADYHRRDVEAEFEIEGIFALPPACGINEQTKPSWPWHWNGATAVVPGDADDTKDDPVYRLRVRGTSDLELIFEIVQPDGNADTLPVALRRSIGLVRLSGDDRNDRDLRLVQGSALDRLLSDKGLRSRMATELAKSVIKDQLAEGAQRNLEALDQTFKKVSLPNELDIAITGSQGLSIAALIGLTAKRDGVSLPLASWGAGTRRMAALAIAAQNQGEAPITIVDEVERGLEPYRQRVLMETMQAGKSQVFLTTHSPTAIAAATNAALWYVDHAGQIGKLDPAQTDRQRRNDPEAFLSRLTIVAEGATEAGLVAVLLEKALTSSPKQHGVHITDAVGHQSALGLLEALASAGLQFGGFADNEALYPARWQAVAGKLDKLLFRWDVGSTEVNVINLLPDDRLEAMLTDPEEEKTGMRLRTLAERLGISENDFAAIRAKAGTGLKALMIEAATGSVPATMTEADKEKKKRFSKHGQNWYKSEAGGRELAQKVFSLGLWPHLKPKLLPFCNAVRKALGLPEIADLV